MNEESDGINDNDNNSEVVILPERSHVEELLLSDQSQLREEQNAYERKLDEKLKDLGLYEDDMTINQKEELLAVVVISCETAEQEENKRQLIREYLEGAQSLEEEIEFSYQESAWLADEANLLCSSTVTQSKDDDISSKQKVLSSFADGEASTSGTKSFDSISLSEENFTKNSPDIFEDETEYRESLENQQSPSSENQLKSPLLKSGSRGVKRSLYSSDSNVKIAVAHPIIQEQDSENPETTEILDRQLSFQRQKLLLDKSMGCWRPCTSPQDKPLSNFRFKQKKKENSSAASFQEKFNKYLSSFEKTASSLKMKRSFVPKVTQLNKPYVLMHHGSVAKKVTKLDNYDYIVGVSEKSQNGDENEDDCIPCSTLTRAKSAFHRVKPISYGKLISNPDQNLQNESSSKITRSGATYGSKKIKLEQEKSESSPEIILEESCNQEYSILKDNSSVISEKRVTFHEDLVNDGNNKLPKFSDLRPDITKCKMVIPSPVVQKDHTHSETPVKTNCDSHPSSHAKKRKPEDAIGNKSEKDYSSDSSSSLIDVETIVDDEIEQFVLKRKTVSGSHKSLNAKNIRQNKRVKKN